MATGNPTLLSGMVAGADLSGSRYHIVKLSAARTVIAGTANVAHGILQNNPVSGAGAAIAAPGSVSKCKMGGTVAAGDLLTATTAGKAIKATPNAAGATNTLVVAIALEAAVVDDVATVLAIGPSIVITT